MQRNDISFPPELFLAACQYLHPIELIIVFSLNKFLYLERNTFWKNKYLTHFNLTKKPELPDNEINWFDRYKKKYIEEIIKGELSLRGREILYWIKDGNLAKLIELDLNASDLKLSNPRYDHNHFYETALGTKVNRTLLLDYIYEIFFIKNKDNLTEISSLNELLIWSVHCLQSLDTFKELIHLFSECVNINEENIAKNWDLFSLVSDIAVTHNLLDILKCLVDEIIIPNSPSEKFAPLLIQFFYQAAGSKEYYACEYSIEWDNTETLRYLFFKLKSLALMTPELYQTFTYDLIRYHQFDMVSYFVESEGIDINKCRCDKWPIGDTDTPLCVAAKNGYYKIVEYFLNKGANPNFGDGRNNTPLHCITPPGLFSCNSEDSYYEDYYDGEGRIKIAKLLLGKGANANAINANGSTPVHSLLNAMADDFYDEVFYKIKIDFRKDNFRKYMYCLLDCLIQYGADINLINNENFTPLCMASKGSGMLEVVEYLIGKGADVNLGNPISQALRHSHDEVTKILIENGADVNLADEHWLQCRLPKLIEVGNMELVKLLVEGRTKILSIVSSTNVLSWNKSDQILECIEYKELSDKNTSLPYTVFNCSAIFALKKFHQILTDKNDLKKAAAVYDLIHCVYAQADKSLPALFSDWSLANNSQYPKETNFELITSHNGLASLLAYEVSPALVSIVGKFSQNDAHMISEKAKTDTMAAIEKLVQQSFRYCVEIEALPQARFKRRHKH